MTAVQTDRATTPIRIESLAALRRAPKIGAPIVVMAHWQERLRGTTRTPKKVQQNGYAYDGTDNDGRACTMWCYHPSKRAEVRFNEDGSVTYFPDSPRSWTLMYFA
jgi:hypothetical protein